MITLWIGLLVAFVSTLALGEDEVMVCMFPVSTLNRSVFIILYFQLLICFAQKCPGGECVKLHLCRDGSIVTDGSNIIDIR